MLADSVTKKAIFFFIAVIIIGLLGSRVLTSAKYNKIENEVKAYESSFNKRKAEISDMISKLDIPDPNFLTCIKTAAYELAAIPPNNTGSIRYLKEIKYLYCPHHKINSIAGISYFENLLFLDISNNYINNIKPIENNHLLESLNIKNNPIKDISILTKLIELKSVKLPLLPHIECDEIQSVIKNIKSNLQSTNCKKKEKRKPFKLKKEQSSYKLSDKEEKEILDYEYNMRRRIY